jgi:cell division protein ZapD
LRIEFLYGQATFHMESESDYGARASITSLLDILAILARGDMRAEALKELERQTETLTHFRRTPGVDEERLTGLIDELAILKSDLAGVGSQFLQPLKDCDFLSAIKHRSAIPGGTCSFDIPDYGYWLNLPFEQRAEQLARWLQPLGPLCAAVAKLLWLTREATEPKRCVAASGFYQSSMERGVALNLVRVQIPQSARFFPEISAGRHRFTVRFVEWRGVDERAAQVTDDVEFKLALS